MNTFRHITTLEGNYSRAAALADRKRYSQSVALIDSMQVNYKLSTARHAEMASLKNLYGLLGTAHSSGKTIANLDSTSILSLKAIAENPTAGVAAQKAQNALCFHYSICYNEQGQPKSTGTARSPKPTYEELLSKLNTATAYPNPSDAYVTIAFTFLHAKDGTELHVFDGLGRQIMSNPIGEVYEGQQFIDTRKLPNGVYPYQIVQEGMKVSEGKFVVVH
jgi:hypothetical protein